MIHARAVTIGDEDFFERLSVPREATPAQVDQAFFAFARLWNVTICRPSSTTPGRIARASFWRSPKRTRR